jgi:hypothetical protein
MAQEASRPRPFTPRQQRQNAAFLAALRRTGNVRLACRELRVHRATYTKRRAKCAAFATLWDMALAAAHAAFQLAGGARPPAARQGRKGQGIRSSRAKSRGAPDDSVPTPFDVVYPEQGRGAQDERGGSNLKTKGGEPTIVRLKNGRLQLRLAPPGRMTDAAEQAYLAALAANANIRLAAKAAGFAHSSFYARRRTWVGFDARMGQALRIGYDRLEYVVMERTLQALTGAEEQGWLGAAIRDNPLPPLTFGQAFQVLCLHRNTVRLDGMRPPGRRSKVEPSPGAAMFALGRNIDAITRANHYQTTGTWTLPGEPAEAPKLPPLEQVTDWSKAATVKVTCHPGRVLFGGWRVEDWQRRKRAGS